MPVYVHILMFHVQSSNSAAICNKPFINSCFAQQRRVVGLKHCSDAVCTLLLRAPQRALNQLTDGNHSGIRLCWERSHL